MKFGLKEVIIIIAILIILYMLFSQSVRKSDVIVLERSPQYIPTPIFIRGGGHGCHGPGPCNHHKKPKLPAAPIPKVHIKPPIIKPPIIKPPPP